MTSFSQLNQALMRIASILFIIMAVLTVNSGHAQKVFGNGQQDHTIAGGGTVEYSDNNRAAIAQYQPGSGGSADGIQVVGTTQSRLYLEHQSGSFAVGDEVLIINMNYGRREKMNHIFALVDTVGSNYIVISKNLATNKPMPIWLHTQGVKKVAKNQVIQVPNYKNLTIEQQAKLTCHPWDGHTGGIVCVKVRETLTISHTGQIAADSMNRDTLTGGLGGAFNSKRNNPLSDTEPGSHQVVSGTNDLNPGDDADIDSDYDKGFFWPAAPGHKMEAFCEVLKDGESGKGGDGTAFPGVLGGKGERKYYSDPLYDPVNTAYRFSIASSGKAGRGGNGPGAGGDGGGGSKGADQFASGGGTTGDSITSGQGGNGGRGGFGGGGILIKAKLITIDDQGMGTFTAFSALGGVGLDGTDGNGSGGNGGDGGDGADGRIKCDSQKIEDLLPQGVGGAPGKGGDGADAGSGGDGGDGGNVWLVTAPLSQGGGVNLPPGPAELDDYTDLTGGIGGIGGIAINATAGTNGAFGADGELNIDAACCFDSGGGGKGGDGDGDGGGGSTPGYWYLRNDQEIEICDCKKAFELLTNATTADTDTSLGVLEYEVSGYSDPTVVGNKNYEKSVYDIGSTRLTSQEVELLRKHRSDSSSGVYLTRKYYCDLNPLKTHQATTNFHGIANLIHNQNDQFSVSPFRVNFMRNPTGLGKSIGYYDPMEYRFIGLYWNEYFDVEALTCLDSLAIGYGEPRDGRDGEPGDTGRTKVLDSAFVVDTNTLEPNLGGGPVPPSLVQRANDESQIQVYPNPTSGLLRIGGADVARLQVHLMNVDGKMVQVKVVSSDEREMLLDLGHLPKGIYHLRIISVNKTHTFKILRM